MRRASMMKAMAAAYLASGLMGPAPTAAEITALGRDIYRTSGAVDQRHNPLRNRARKLKREVGARQTKKAAKANRRGR